MFYHYNIIRLIVYEKRNIVVLSTTYINLFLTPMLLQLYLHEININNYTNKLYFRYEI